ncbi:flagellar export chaperone FliS [Jeotgalibaca arthritidis]|uniref:flagellar export chaperone FliS n=1 Tax=Jeotgalibaca arthritidis TaxID=1868794 RepID=UPI00359F3692
MYNKNAKNMYQQNQILTASPKKLVSLLFEGSIKNLSLAKIYIEKNDFEQANKTLQKHQNIIVELQSTLNFEEGGEVAKSLDTMYTYLYEQAMLANVQKDVTIIENSIKIVKELLESWNQI